MTAASFCKMLRDDLPVQIRRYSDGKAWETLNASEVVSSKYADWSTMDFDMSHTISNDAYAIIWVIK